MSAALERVENNLIKAIIGLIWWVVLFFTFGLVGSMLKSFCYNFFKLSYLSGAIIPSTMLLSFFYLAGRS